MKAGITERATVWDLSEQRLVSVLLGTALLLGALLLVPLPTGQNHREGWIIQMRDFVLLQKRTAEIARGAGEALSAGFEAYLGQLELVQNFFRSGDHRGTYRAMNRFMDMLETREGGISDQAADAIWDYCNEVTPKEYHDKSRHLKKARTRVTFDEWAATTEGASPPIW